MGDGRRILKRAGAVLCAVLMMVFVQAAAASIVAGVQHAVSGPDHRHMLFTDISLDDDHHAAGQHHQDHDADHHDTDHDADHASDHVSDHDGHQAVPHGSDGHHHHHGDVGANVMVLASLEAAGLHAPHDLQQPDPGRLIVEVRHFLPDRPPRAFLAKA
jgi:hypothetical protein